MGEPSLNFNALMDIYSLGTVLLELAEWRALRYIVDSVVDVGAENVPLNKLAEVQPFLLSGRGKGGTSKLRTKMGDIYTSVCFLCLGGKVEEAKLDQDGGFESQGSLLDVAVQRLESCKIGSLFIQGLLVGNQYDIMLSLRFLSTLYLLAVHSCQCRAGTRYYHSSLNHQSFVSVRAWLTLLQSYVA